jgi:hypothetical protein
MKINSVFGMLELLKAIRKTAIRDELSYRKTGFKKGEDSWEEWKESQCRYIYYHCYVLISEIEKNKSNPIILPKGENSW